MSVSLKSIWNASISNIDNILKSQHIEELNEVMKYITVSKLYSKSNQLSKEESEIVNDYNFTKAMLQTKKYSHKKRLNEGLRMLYEMNQSDKIVSNTILSSDIRSTRKQLELLKSDLHASRKLKRLSGVVSFEFFDNIPSKHGPKRLLLLGEIHNIEGICKNNNNNTFEVHRWLYELIQHAPECTDLFVEEDYQDDIGLSIASANIDDYNMTDVINEDLNKYESGLVAIKRAFGACKFGNSIYCPLHKLRYHYIDIRIHKCRTQMYDFLSYIDSNKIDENSYETSYRFLRSNFESIIKYYSGVDNSIKGKKLYNEFISILTKNIIVKQNENDFNDIQCREYYINVINKTINKIDDFNKTNFWNVFFSCYQELPKEYINLIEILTHVPMDMYFLLRYLHSYDLDKMERGPLGCKDIKFKEAINSIVYGGDYHIHLYSIFFKKYFKINSKIFVRNNTNDKCLVLPEFFDFYNNNN